MLGQEEGRNVLVACPPWIKGIKPMAQWKKTGDSCPHCGHETEVLVGAKGQHDSVYCAERCWRCGWVVAEFGKKKEVNGTKDSLSVKGTRTPRSITRSMVSGVDLGTATTLKPPDASMRKPIHT